MLKNTFKSIILFIIFFTIINFFWFILSHYHKFNQNIEFDIRSNETLKAQIFWIPFYNSFFTEKNSSTFTIEKGNDFKKYSLRLPNYPIKLIRFDPLNKVGNINIKNIRYTAGQFSEILELKKNIDFSKGLKIVSEKNYFNIESITDDPQISISVPDFFNKSTNTSIFNLFSDNSNLNAKCFFLVLIFLFIFLSEKSIIKLKFFKTLFCFVAFSIFLYLISKVHPITNYISITSISSVGHMNYYGLSKFDDKFLLWIIIAFFPIIVLLNNFFNKENND